MAIVAIVAGAAPKEVSSMTIAGIKRELDLPDNYKAVVNGEPEDNEHAELDDFSIVHLASAKASG